jgi:hypothetical protein
MIVRGFKRGGVLHLSGGIAAPPPPDPTEGWDVEVVNVLTNPANPVAGDNVVFSAVLHNKGTEDSPAGIQHGVQFQVGGVPVTWHDERTASIPAGQTVTVVANGGVTNNQNYWPASGTSAIVTAHFDDALRFTGANAEADTTNNVFTKTIQITPLSGPVNTVMKAGSYVESATSSAINVWTGFASRTATPNLVMMRFPISQWDSYENTFGGYIYDEVAMGASWLAGDPRRIFILSIPMLQSSHALQWDDDSVDHFHGMLATLIASFGIADRTIIRLGWEPNDSYGWSWQPPFNPTLQQVNDCAAGYVRCWRRLYDVYMAIAPGLKFDWCTVAFDSADNDRDPRKWYPGADKVHIHGMDFYDRYYSGSTTPANRWASLLPHHQRHIAFAVEKGKPCSLDEWGLWSTSDGTGGGDDPYYIHRIADLVENTPSFHHTTYFDSSLGGVGTHLNASETPGALAAYTERFAKYAS